jgi:hypothetical protein
LKYKIIDGLEYRPPSCFDSCALSSVEALIAELEQHRITVRMGN